MSQLLSVKSACRAKSTGKLLGTSVDEFATDI